MRRWKTTMRTLAHSSGLPRSALLRGDPQKFLRVSDPAYWRELAPGLSISNGQDVPTPRRISAIKLKEEQLSQLRRDIAEEGYFHLSSDSLAWGTDFDLLVRAVHDLEAAGWNAAWLLLFDEAWELCHGLSSILLGTVQSSPVFDMYVFNIAMGRGKGWDIHRDRWDYDATGSAASNLSSTFHADGTPKYATVWIALSEATPLNSCIYCLPKGSDKYYMGPDHGNYADPKLHAGVQEIRALPAKPGDVYVWSHRLLHWGSSSSSRAACPRVALSFSVAASDFEKPVLARGMRAMPVPTWEERLVLCAFQLAMYSQHEPLGQARSIVSGLLAKHKHLLTKDGFEKLSPEVLDELFPTWSARARHSFFLS